MKTTIKDKVLHIEIPLHAPRLSSTGKTLTVASSNGNQIHRCTSQRITHDRRIHRIGAKAARPIDGCPRLQNPAA